MKTTEFSDKDLITNPTFVQEAVVDAHEEIGGYSEVKYKNDGVTVFFKFADGWVGVKPPNPFLGMGGSENGISMSQIRKFLKNN